MTVGMDLSESLLVLPREMAAAVTSSVLNALSAQGATLWDRLELGIGWQGRIGPGPSDPGCSALL